MGTSKQTKKKILQKVLLFFVYGYEKYICNHFNIVFTKYFSVLSCNVIFHDNTF